MRNCSCDLPHIFFRQEASSESKTRASIAALEVSILESWDGRVVRNASHRSVTWREGLQASASAITSSCGYWPSELFLYLSCSKQLPQNKQKFRSIKCTILGYDSRVAQMKLWWLQLEG
jgi:hypothetical protein